MAFKMKGYSAFTKNEDDNDKASSILNEEIQISDDGKITLLSPPGITGVSENAVVNDPKSIVKNNPNDDYLYSLKGDTVTITGIEKQ